MFEVMVRRVQHAGVFVDCVDAAGAMEIAPSLVEPVLETEVRAYDVAARRLPLTERWWVGGVDGHWQYPATELFGPQQELEGEQR